LSIAQHSRCACFPVGIYKLDASTEGLTGFSEFSLAEYAAMGRLFEAEKSYNAPVVNFLGRAWNIRIGTVCGKIYKIAPYLVLASKAEADPIAQAALKHCNEQLGKPVDQKTGLFQWDVGDGNAILLTDENREGFLISLVLTSKAARQFKRL
jgi:hypothetical protein